MSVRMKNSSARSRHRPPNNQPKPQPCCSCTAFNEACTAFLRIMSRVGAKAFERFRCTALRSAPEGRASRPGQRSYAILPFRNLLH